MKRVLNNILILSSAFVALAAVSCVRDKVDSAAAVEAGIHFETRSAMYTSDPDNKITCLRIMTFDGSGKQTSNVYYDSNAIESNSVTHYVKPGVYTFYLLANEANTTLPTPEGPTALNTLIDGSTETAFKQALYSTYANCYNQTREIPMMERFANVTVQSDGKVQYGGTVYTT